MKPKTALSIRRTSRLKAVAAVVVTAVAALGLPAQAWALEPEPSASPTATAATPASQTPTAASVTTAGPTTAPGPAVPSPAAVATTATQAPATAPPTPAPSGTAPGTIDMKALNAAIGANGAYMGQGLKTRLSGSPRSGATSAVTESLQIESTWKAPGIQGLDVSGYQPTVNWATQYSMGARFAYVKASEGLSYRSPTFASQYSGAQAAGLLRGAYHFALPSISTGAAQADYFINSGGGWSPDGKTMPPLLDIEYNPYSHARQHLLQHECRRHGRLDQGLLQPHAGPDRPPADDLHHRGLVVPVHRQLGRLRKPAASPGVLLHVRRQCTQRLGNLQRLAVQQHRPLRRRLQRLERHLRELAEIRLHCRRRGP